MGLIQTEQQLKFSYMAIIEGAKQLELISTDLLADMIKPPVNRRSSTSSSSSDDDEAPPLPPRRSDSLVKSNLFNGNEMIIIAGEEDDDFNALPAYLREQAVISNTNGHNESSTSSSEPTPPDKMAGGLAPPTHQRLVASVSAPLQHDNNHELGFRIKTDFSNLGGSTSNTASPTRCILNNHKMEERKRY